MKSLKTKAKVQDLPKFQHSQLRVKKINLFHQSKSPKARKSSQSKLKQKIRLWPLKSLHLHKRATSWRCLIRHSILTPVSNLSSRREILILQTLNTNVRSPIINNMMNSRLRFIVLNSIKTRQSKSIRKMWRKIKKNSRPNLKNKSQLSLRSLKRIVTKKVCRRYSKKANPLWSQEENKLTLNKCKRPNNKKILLLISNRISNKSKTINSHKETRITKRKTLPTNNLLLWRFREVKLLTNNSTLPLSMGRKQGRATGRIRRIKRIKRIRLSLKNWCNWISRVNIGSSWIKISKALRGSNRIISSNQIAFSCSLSRGSNIS